MADQRKSYVFYFIACFAFIVAGLVLLTGASTTSSVQATEGDIPRSAPIFNDPESQVFEFFLDVEENSRRFKVFVPGIYFRTETEVPLIFAFHGFTNTPEIAQADYQLDEIAETENFINVYPAGLSNNWDVFTPESTRDLDFVLAMIDFMKNEFRIKEKSIYSTGYSHGGFFTTILACSFPDIFAAIAPIAGTFYRNVLPVCSPSKPIPYLEIHGTTDFVIPYDGNLRTVSVDDALAFWAEVNGQSATPVIIEDESPGVDRFIFSPDNVVQHYRANRVGHSDIAYFPTEKIIAFFKEVTEF